MQTSKPIGIVPRLLVCAASIAFASHLLIQAFPGLVLGEGVGASLHRSALGRYAHSVALVEVVALRHPALASVGAALVAIALVGLYRWCVASWNARFTARTTRLDDDLKGLRFPTRAFDVWRHLLDRGRRGRTFVGLTPKARLLPPWGVSWRPVYLSSDERSMHRHVLGKTGSGKTTSILWPQIFQDSMDGKGVLVMDAKGSDENARTIRSIAVVTGRERQLRIFALPAWNRPTVFSHAYNMVHVGPGGDVVAMAERVFAAFEMGDNPYYNTQALSAFSRICRVLHGTREPFNLHDVNVCLSALTAASSPAGKAWKHCLDATTDREAVHDLAWQAQSLGKDLAMCMSGLSGAVSKFLSPIVNAYAPDLTFESALQENLIVYIQLPSNLYKLQAPALGKMMLMDLQQEASLRQVFRSSRNQIPFSVNIDEFGSFADLSVVDSLNKLRDAHLQFTLSHQSLADLELVSKEFAQAVWDNTRTKDVLAQDNAELCERMARSLGTTPRLEHTVQQGRDFLATTVATGAMSTRAVESYRLHPNRLKMLAARGQGFLFASRPEGRTAIPVAYGQLPDLPADFRKPLARHDQARAPGLRLYERFVAGVANASAR